MKLLNGFILLISFIYPAGCTIEIEKKPKDVKNEGEIPHYYNDN